jgi:hypothetical protein
MLAIVDLDGTICSIQNRLKYAGPEPDRKDKAKLQQWLNTLQNEKMLAEDPPISQVCVIARMLHQSGHKVVFLTGRSDKWKSVTQAWLNRYAFRTIPLYMRAENDWRSPGEFKKEQIIKILNLLKPELVVAIDDDSGGCTEKVYEELGICFLKVHESTNQLKNLTAYQP